MPKNETRKASEITARARCKREGIARTWIASATQSDLDAFNAGGSAPTESAPAAEGSGGIAAIVGLVDDALAKHKREMVEMVDDRVADLELSQPLVMHFGETRKFAVPGMAHPALPEVLECLHSVGLVFMCGPAGTGKSTLGEHAAKALGLQFGAMSCTAGASESHANGRMLFDGEFVGTDFLTCYEEGGLFLLDEICAADPNMLLVLNTALSNKWMAVPNRKGNRRAAMHAEFKCAAADNTWGDGADLTYSGRSAQDGALLDRFAGVKVDVGYHVKLERAIAAEAGAPWIAELVHKMRANCIEAGIDRIVGTRAIIQGAQRYVVNPAHSADTIAAILTRGWESEEREKALAGAL